MTYNLGPAAAAGIVCRPSSAARLVVQRWIDDAVEQISNMMYTCSLDVTRDYSDGLSESSVAFLLGVTEQSMNAETRVALIKFRQLAIEAEAP